jgi:hypothetical protein
MNREQLETRLRQDIESAWEPYWDRDTIPVSKFTRKIKAAMEDALVFSFVDAAHALLREFIEESDIDLDELDELATVAVDTQTKWVAAAVAETTRKWVEDDDNHARAFNRERAELIAITEITRARSQGERAAAEMLAELGIPVVGTWFTMEDERVCLICGPLHLTPEAYWSQFFPEGSPAHPRCRCRLDWKEKAKRKPAKKRTKKVSRMQGTAPEAEPAATKKKVGRLKKRAPAEQPAPTKKKVGRLKKRTPAEQPQPTKKKVGRLRRRVRESVGAVKEIAVKKSVNLQEGGKGSGIKGHRTIRPGSAQRAGIMPAAKGAKKMHELTREEYAAHKFAAAVKEANKDHAVKLADLESQLQLARDGALPANVLANLEGQDPVAFYRELVADAKDRHERTMEIWHRPNSSKLYSFMVEHENVVQRAIKAGKHVPDSVLEDYTQSRWFPEAKRLELETKAQRKLFIREATEAKETADFKQAGRRMERVMAKHADALDGLHKKARDAVKQVNERTENSVQYGVAQSRMKELRLEMESMLHLAQNDFATGKITAEEKTQRYGEYYKKLNEYENEAKSFEVAREDMNKAIWKAIAVPEEERVASVTYKLEDGFQHDITGQNQVAEMVRQVVSSKVLPGNIGLSYKVKPIQAGAIDGSRMDTERAYASGDAMHVRPNENAATIAHELGHIIDSRYGSKVGKLSVGYLAKRTAGMPVEHLGASYGNYEVATGDHFKDKYTGKHYDRESSEILSMGMQYLFNDATEFSFRDPDHFKYTVGVLQGVIREGDDG